MALAKCDVCCHRGCSTTSVIIKFYFITVRVVVKSVMSDFTNLVCEPSFAQAFLSAITPEEYQTTAYTCAPELRTTSVRRRTCVGYDAPTAGS